MIAHAFALLSLAGAVGPSQEDVLRRVFESQDNEQLSRLRGVRGVQVLVIPGRYVDGSDHERIKIACENLIAAAGLEPGKKTIVPREKTSVLDEILGPALEDDVLLFIRTEARTNDALAIVTDRVLVKRNKVEFIVDTWKFMEYRPGGDWTSRNCPTAESFMQFSLDATNKLISHIRRANK